MGLDPIATLELNLAETEDLIRALKTDAQVQAQIRQQLVKSYESLGISVPSEALILTRHLGRLEAESLRLVGMVATAAHRAEEEKG